MHVDSSKFLVSVVEPLQLTIQAPLVNETADQLGLALQGHLSLLRARGFQPTVVYVDPQSGFQALKNLFPGVLIDTGGRSDYVPKVDSNSKRIKEHYCAVKNGLPWRLLTALVKDLVCYAVGRINIQRTTSIASNLSPHRLFTGTRVNYKKSLELAFGDYAEVFDGTDNTSRSHTIPCIALHPCNNSTGSWEYLNLLTGNRVHRSSWKRMVTTEVIIARMNAMTSVNIGEDSENGGASERTEVPAIATEAEVRAPVGHVENAPPTNPTNDHVEQNEVMILDGTRETASSAEQPAETAEIPQRRSARIAQGVSQPERYLLMTKIQETTKRLADDREQAKLGAIQKEILQIFEELQAVMPVMKDDIPEDAEVLRCFIFLVEKFLQTENLRRS
jgi:hypothetical protein